MSVDSDIKRFAEMFTRLQVNTAGGVSPHKPCLLLAVLDLAEAGNLVSNEIRYRPELLERFADYFAAVRTERDRPNAYMPFFHLKSDGFWNLRPLVGREAALEAMSTAVKHGDVANNIQAAVLDERLHRLVQSREARETLRATLIGHWFADRGDAVWNIVNAHQHSNREERQLRDAVATGELKARDSQQPARTAAFRRLVLEAYDYRCAASGWRVILPGGTTLLEAAHIVPFSSSYNDDPRNGLALTPTFHVALDKNLIAPGPDMKWHISPLFEKRIPDNRPFVELDGQPLIYEGDERFRPSKDSLHQRLEMLRTE